jgi:hypothetical protein
MSKRSPAPLCARPDCRELANYSLFASEAQLNITRPGAREHFVILEERLLQLYKQSIKNTKKHCIYSV